MKKFCAILFSFVLVLMLALPVAAEDAAGESDSLFDTAPALTAPAGYVVNLDTNIVVYEKNSETQLSAASLTKMMTTLLLLENYQHIVLVWTKLHHVKREKPDKQGDNSKSDRKICFSLLREESPIREENSIDERFSEYERANESDIIL